MSGDQLIAKFAARRPDWELPQLQLEQLQLHPFDALEQATSRQPCPKCHKSRFLYCYDCAVAFTPIPSVQLPFQLSIITHHAELASKNTGVMAAILCPGQVQLHSIEQMPDCDPACCAVMFPCDDALLPDQLDLQQLQRVIILDSKWAKAKELNAHPALRGMKRVKLPGCPKSCFWRFHTSGVTDEGVCTIEALHLLLTAVAGRLPDPAQRSPHCFDNLLWYFAYQHQLVARKAAERQQKKAQQQQLLPQQQQQQQQQEEGQLRQGGGVQQQQQQQQQQPRYPQQRGKRRRRQPPGDESRQQQQQPQQQDYCEQNRKPPKQQKQQQRPEEQQQKQHASGAKPRQGCELQQAAAQPGSSLDTLHDRRQQQGQQEGNGSAQDGSQEQHENTAEEQ